MESDKEVAEPKLIFSLEGPIGIGKTLVSSQMIDRVAKKLGRKLVEVPVGFKWFVGGLYDGSLGFGGEESAGASFLDRQGKVWSTDKDGIIAAKTQCVLLPNACPLARR